MTTNREFRVSSEIRNKLKLDTANSFYRVQDWSTVPQKKFERVLYFLNQDENEQVAVKDLSSLCSPGGLALLCNIPEVNKRLSNGTLKHNKNVLTEYFSEIGIERYWFLTARRDDVFDLLVEIKNG